jgi:hypothetical protein
MLAARQIAGHAARVAEAQAGGGKEGCQRAPHPAALTADEARALLVVLDSERFADKSSAQMWAIVLDERIYFASVSSMYRVLRRSSGSAAIRACTPPRWSSCSSAQLSARSPPRGHPNWTSVTKMNDATPLASSAPRSSRPCRPS